MLMSHLRLEFDVVLFRDLNLNCKVKGESSGQQSLD
jgi:hypothetical protein